MATDTPTESKPLESSWNDASLALVGGIAVLGGMVFLVGLIRPAGLSPPPAAALPLFVFNTTAAVMAFVLLQRSSGLGYAAGIITGVLVVASIVLLATGTVGELPSGGNPTGPLVYAALGVAVILTTGVAWRKQAGDNTSASSSTRSS